MKGGHTRRQRLAIRNVMSRRINAAAAKNKRVFLDDRSHRTLILDFRGDSGMGALDPKKLQEMFRDFVLDAEKAARVAILRASLASGLIASYKGSRPIRGHSAIESFKGQLGFLVQQVYKWDMVELGFEYPNSLADALQQEGWKVTRK